MKNREKWMELCEQASTEQNPEKLIKLTAEIIRLLGEKNKRLHDPPATPNEARRLNSGSTRIHEVPGHDAARKRLHDLLTAAPQDLTHDDRPLPETPIFPRVQEIRVSTLILIGSGDIEDNHAVAGALVMAIPGAARVVVPDAGHLMYLEKPEEFIGRVSTSLAAHGF
jgi:pimeloyl-ACP methyl ester carboxylesterase